MEKNKNPGTPRVWLRQFHMIVVVVVVVVVSCFHDFLPAISRATLAVATAADSATSCKGWVLAVRQMAS
jgi:hypothetical protein